MTDREKGDHWGQLASNLGAEIREEAELLQPAVSPAEAPAPSAERVEAEKPRRPRPRADWGEIASALGIEAPPAAPVAQATVEPSDKSEPVHEPCFESEPADRVEPESQPQVSAEQLAETVAGLPASVKTAPASIGHEPTMRIGHERPAAEEGFGLGILEEAPASEEDGESTRGKSRRRRRRRPRSGARQPATLDSTDSSEMAADSESDTGADFDVESCDVPRDPSEFESAVEGEAGPVEVGSESEEKRRSKRRRSRRRRPKGEATDAMASPKSVASTHEADDDGSLDDPDADDMADMLDGEGFSDKSGHRSIPVWHEAISIVIEKNLESRAKRPDGGGQQKRGGRRSGRRGRG